MRIDHTFRGQIAQGCCTVPLNLNTFRVGERYQDIKHPEAEEMRLQLIAKCEDGDRSSHFRLDGQRNPENQVLAFLNCAGLQDKFFVAIRAGGKIAKRGDGMALDFFVVGRTK